MGNCTSTTTNEDAVSTLSDVLPSPQQEAVRPNASVRGYDRADSFDSVEGNVDMGHNEVSDNVVVVGNRSLRCAEFNASQSTSSCGNPLAIASKNTLARLNAGSPRVHSTAWALTPVSSGSNDKSLISNSPQVPEVLPCQGQECIRNDAESPQASDAPLVCLVSVCSGSVDSDRVMFQSIPSLDSIDPDYGEKFTRRLQTVPSVSGDVQIQFWIRHSLAESLDTIPDGDTLSLDTSGFASSRH